MFFMHRVAIRIYNILTYQKKKFPHGSPCSTFHLPPSHSHQPRQPEVTSHPPCAAKIETIREETQQKTYSLDFPIKLALNLMLQIPDTKPLYTEAR